MGSVLEHPSMVVSFSVGLRKTYGAALMRLHSAFGFDRYAVGNLGALSPRPVVLICVRIVLRLKKGRFLCS